MTKAEVEALPLSASVRTNSPFTVKAPSPGSTVRPGEVKYETSVQMPGSNNPLQTFLLFKDDRLTEIFVSLDTEALLDALRKQVSDKYGASVREDSRKEEDCIYRNGNSFKLKSGALHDRWHTAMPGAADSKIQTALGDFLVNICPASLRDGLNPIQVRSVSIRVISTTPAEPKANLF